MTVRAEWGGRALALVAALLSSAATAQTSGRLPVIAILSPEEAVAGSCSEGPTISAFVAGLRELGLVADKTVRLQFHCAGWDFDRLPALARNIVDTAPDLIFTHTTNGVVAARGATDRIPIVVGAAGDMVARGLVDNYARPSGNITGMMLPGNEFYLKLIQLLKEAVPSVRGTAVLVNAANPAWNSFAEELRKGWLGLEITRVPVRSRDDIVAAITEAAASPGQSLLVVSDALFNRNASLVAGEALRQKLPLISQNDGAAAGALIAYGPDVREMHRRAAGYAEKILKGVAVRDLPIEYPTKFRLTVNLKTAKALGLTMPAALLLRADEVIE